MILRFDRWLYRVCHFTVILLFLLPAGISQAAIKINTLKITYKNGIVRTIQTRYNSAEYKSLFPGYVQDAELIQINNYSPNDLTEEQYETWLAYRQIYLDPVEQQILERKRAGLPPILDIPERPRDKESEADSLEAALTSRSPENRMKFIRLPQIKIPGDLAWDGEYLWITDLSGDTTIHKIDLYKGIILQSFQAPSKGYGLTSDGESLYFAGYPDVIYKLDSETGQVIYSVNNTEFSAYGLAWDGERLLGSDCNHNKIYRFSSISGVSYENMDSPGDLSIGLCWDGNYIYSVDNGTKMIYQIDTTTKQTISVKHLGAISYVTGIVYDGYTFWINDLDIHAIYQYQFKP